MSAQACRSLSGNIARASYPAMKSALLQYQNTFLSTYPGAVCSQRFKLHPVSICVLRICET